MHHQAGTPGEDRCAASAQAAKGVIATVGCLSRSVGLNDTAELRKVAIRDISMALNMLLADVVFLFLKTKSFHLHMSGPNFRGHVSLLQEQANEILATVDPLASRVRKIGGMTTRSISHIGGLQRLLDNDSQYESPREMLVELCGDNEQRAGHIRAAYSMCSELCDIASASLIENVLDETEAAYGFYLK